MFESDYQELSTNKNIELRKNYWELAKELQKPDGLKTSQYLETVIIDTLEEKYDTSQACIKVEKYYEKVDSNSIEARNHKEADISASRITAILERGGFTFSPATLCSIHRELFQDILPEEWVGTYRKVNITKPEAILAGQTVSYSDYKSIKDTLNYDFNEEKQAKYMLPFTDLQIENLAKFTSNIWQVHPFREGNTRTVATFILLYLKNFGIEIDNTPFQKNAIYFRNALVRSNYSNLKHNIHEEISFLKIFFENILTDKKHDLSKIDLHCQQLFSH